MENFEKLMELLSKHNVLVYKSDGQGACEIVFKRAADIGDVDDSDSETSPVETKTGEMESRDTDTVVGFNPKGMYAALPNLLDFEQ